MQTRVGRQDRGGLARLPIQLQKLPTYNGWRIYGEQFTRLTEHNCFQPPLPVVRVRNMPLVLFMAFTLFTELDAWGYASMLLT